MAQRQLDLRNLVEQSQGGSSSSFAPSGGGFNVPGFMSGGQSGGGLSFGGSQGGALSGATKGVADLIDQAAEESIARLGRRQKQQSEQLSERFTSRGLLQSGLAAGAQEQLGQETLRRQRQIERDRLGKLSELARSAIRARSGGRVVNEARDQEDKGTTFGASFKKPVGIGGGGGGGIGLPGKPAKPPIGFPPPAGGGGGGGGKGPIVDVDPAPVNFGPTPQQKQQNFEEAINQGKDPVDEAVKDVVNPGRLFG